MSSDGNFFEDVLTWDNDQIEEDEKDAENKKKKIAAADAATAENAKNKNTEEIDTMNASSQVYTPTYIKGSAKYNKDQEALTLLFNQRKQELLNRTRAPGISQTRLN